MAQRTIIEPQYVVMAAVEWSADMIPLAAMEMQGIANDFAIYWTEHNHRIFGRSFSAGVYEGKTGKLLIGYRDGEIIYKEKHEKTCLYPQ